MDFHTYLNQNENKGGPGGGLQRKANDGSTRLNSQVAPGIAQPTGPERAGSATSSAIRDAQAHVNSLHPMRYSPWMLWLPGVGTVDCDSSGLPQTDPR